MNSDVPFGAWLKQQRRALDLSREQLAAQVGCSISLLEKLETGERRPSRQVAMRIALCLVIPAEQRDAFLAAARVGRAPQERGQLPTPTAPTTLAPPRTGRLPTPISSFIGREWEVATVAARLRTPEVRLITLTGPGGVGKTCLALQIGNTLHDGFPDGVWFVDLAPISDPALVLPIIAQALGVREQPGMSPVETLRAALHDQQLLLLLDNFEQVVAAAPELAQLLAGVSGMKVLVTSREALRLSGEHVVVVAPLAIPESTPIRSAKQLTQYAAAQLFVARAQASSDLFRLTDANAPAVAAICARLDGLPLAIELAAAWVPLFQPAALLARLERRLPILRRGPHDVPARQQTLRNTIDWSYDLLTEAEQLFLRRLGVFVGGCTLEAAEELLRTADRGQSEDALDSALSSQSFVPDDITALTDKSSLRQEEGLDGEPRFKMLETIREYALERLIAGGEAEPVRWQHAQFFLALAEEASPQLFFTLRSHWLERLEREHDNLRAALRWFIDLQSVEVGLRLGSALCSFWEARGYLTEGRKWMADLLALASAGPRMAARAKALLGAGNLAYAQGDYMPAETLLTESLAIGRDVGDSESIAWSQYRLGTIAGLRRQDTQSRAYLEESVALFRTMDNQRGAAWSLAVQGFHSHFMGDATTAGRLLEDSMAIGRKIGDTFGIANALHLLAQVRERQGDLATARTYEEESLTIWRAAGRRALYGARTDHPRYRHDRSGDRAWRAGTVQR